MLNKFTHKFKHYPEKETKLGGLGARSTRYEIECQFNQNFRQQIHLPSHDASALGFTLPFGPETSGSREDSVSKEDLSVEGKEIPMHLGFGNSPTFGGICDYCRSIRKSP